MGKGLGFMSRGLAIAIIATCAIVAPLAGIAAAGQGQGASGGTEVLATLKVEAQNVTVKKAGADGFKPAKDGQKLRQGDTVQTDATGTAEIDYSDDAYTRLDVNTTFTITKLTEEQGERQVEGSLETGRTWNRTAAVTESGSFEQGGAGATAAVVGTAFSVECTSATECEFTAVEHQIQLTGDGEVHILDPLNQCDSEAGDICDTPDELSIDEIAAISWIQENLFRDLTERGVGDGPFVPSFTLVVVGGEVVEVIETPPPTEEEVVEEPTTTTSTTTTSSTTTSSTTTTTLAPPGVGSPTINVKGGGKGGGTPTARDTGCEIVAAAEPCNADEIVTEDEVGTANSVEFTINLTGAPEHAGALKIKFTGIPGTDAGTSSWSNDGGTTWTQILPTDVNLTQFDEATLFRFVPVEIEPVCNDADGTDADNVVDEFEECYSTGTTPYPSTPTDNGDGSVQWTAAFTVTIVDTADGREERAGRHPDHDHRRHLRRGLVPTCVHRARHGCGVDRTRVRCGDDNHDVDDDYDHHAGDSADDHERAHDCDGCSGDGIGRSLDEPESEARCVPRRLLNSRSRSRRPTPLGGESVALRCRYPRHGTKAGGCCEGDKGTGRAVCRLCRSRLSSGGLRPDHPAAASSSFEADEADSASSTSCDPVLACPDPHADADPHKGDRRERVGEPVGHRVHARRDPGFPHRACREDLGRDAASGCSVAVARRVGFGRGRRHQSDPGLQDRGRGRDARTRRRPRVRDERLRLRVLHGECLRDERRPPHPLHREQRREPDRVRRPHGHPDGTPVHDRSTLGLSASVRHASKPGALRRDGRLSRRHGATEQDRVGREGPAHRSQRRRVSGQQPTSWLRPPDLLVGPPKRPGDRAAGEPWHER